MKYKIVADTRDAYNSTTDRKRFDFDLKKGIPINEKSTIKFESATNIRQATPASPYDPGLLVIGGLVIDPTTNQDSDYGGALDQAGSYARTTILDLNNSEQCSVVKNSDGTTLSAGRGGALKLITFKDLPDNLIKKCVVAQVIATGSGYQNDEHILVKQAAFPTGYRTSTSDMRIDINRLRTSEMKEPGDFKEGFLTIQLDPGYIGEAFGSALNHPSVSTGQGSFLTLGRSGGSGSVVQLVSIDSGGYGFEAGDIFYVPKEDALPSFIPPQFYVPLKIEVLTAVAAIPPSAPVDANKGYKIGLTDIMTCGYNIRTSDTSFQNNIINQNFILHDEIQTPTEYKSFDIIPQVISRFSLTFEPFNFGSGLNPYSLSLIHI